MALTWTEKLALLTQKGLTWKEVQEMDKGLDNEKVEPKPDPEPEPEPKPKPDPKPDEKDKRIAELEAQLKEAQSENVNGNNEGLTPSFDEQLDTMFKDYRF